MPARKKVESNCKLNRNPTMTMTELRIINGPTKPDLQWAVAYPERHLHVHFDGHRDSVDAHIDTIEELGDGTQFALQGHLTSGLYKGWPFRCVYDLSTRSGVLRTRKPDTPSRA
jgi:hypothetical protein